MKEENCIDGYKQFFELFPKEEFFKFGIDNIITIESEKAKNEWNELKRRIQQKSNDLYIRDYGRNGSGNKKIEEFYSSVFGIQVNFDNTNNAQPSRVLQNLTGYKRNETIRNYQVSHVFGRTKNVFCFTAPWNIVFLPKIVDPFTGHEAKGDFIEEFQLLFRHAIILKYKDLIIEYNEIMKTKKDEISTWMNNAIEERNNSNIVKDFMEIEIN
jgi:hypothetical protein